MTLILRALAECSTLEEAKAIARDLRHTARVVSDKYGVCHPITVDFDSRYWGFVDEMACRFGRDATEHTT